MKFLWISGSINAGKSTIAARIHKHIKKSVNIELDALRLFAGNNTLDSLGDYTMIDALDLAKKWSGRGYFPILNYPMWGDAKALFGYSEKLGLEPIIINLTPSKEIAKTNRGERELTQWEAKRIDYMYDTENVHKPLRGHIIDNTFQSIEETTEEVLKIISEDVKPYL